MKKFPILYSRAATGALQQWQIIATDDYFYTIAGQVGGALTESKPNKCTGKNIGRSNETTPEQQALAEAQSKFEKKVKLGYKKDPQDVDQETYFEPMLAKVFTDRLDKVVYPVLVDRKYNGGRMITMATGQFTRKGEAYKSVPHLFEAQEALFKKYPDLVLDGEAYNHELRYKLNELMSIIRRTKNITAEHLKRSREIVRYYVYDGFGFDDVTEDTPQLVRRSKLLNMLSREKIEFVEPVVGEMAQSEKEVWDIYNRYVQDGYEGAMVRLNGLYKNGRSSDLLKVKPEDDAEGLILDVMEGSGNWSGSGKTVKLRWNGIEFDASVKGTYEQAVQLLKEKDKWIGREATFVYNGLTGLGVPNYARIDLDNCFKV